MIAESKDHLNWELIGKCAKRLRGDAAKVVMAARAQQASERSR